jgi:ATP-dependent RNA helicase DDX46/PRP5
MIKTNQKDALLPITEFTGCAITTRGTYVPPGRSAPSGERKLYLYIEGPDKLSVLTARSDIKRMINEAALHAIPEREQYSKYTI